MLTYDTSILTMGVNLEKPKTVTSTNTRYVTQHFNSNILHTNFNKINYILFQTKQQRNDNNLKCYIKIKISEAKQPTFLGLLLIVI
jgi:hypothetical protein